jgi:hypothetical protein
VVAYKIKLTGNMTTDSNVEMVVMVTDNANSALKILHHLVLLEFRRKNETEGRTRRNRKGS